MILEGNFINVFTEQITPAKIIIERNKILKIEENCKNYSNYLVPGFIDAHIHIESSMLCPSRFAEVVVPHGTTAVITDPHEIANVMGVKGIEYMMRDAASTPLRIFFTAPSCVPATPFETAGAILTSKELEKIMKMESVVALGEMMNFPGVINEDSEVLKKLEIAKSYGKPIDGHAPLLSGEALRKYISYGISTDHECTNLAEAREKANLGMKIMIREGSASKNLEGLIEVAKETECFLVSDDKHPHDLKKGHLDDTLRKAVSFGLDPIKALKMVTINPAYHYNLECGVIFPDKKADIVEITNLKKFDVKRVWIDGKPVAKNGKILFSIKPHSVESTFKVKLKKPQDFVIPFKKNGKVKVRVIEVIENQILTEEIEVNLEVRNKAVQLNIEKDILKIAVVERYGHENIGKGFVRGFNLIKGAIASSVAHDSHNIIVVGTNDADMAKAVNTVINSKGGLAVCNGDNITKRELPIAGLMTTERIDSLCKKLDKLAKHARKLGCELEFPFMTISFLALLVIPELKLSDKGLFDSKNFKFVDVVKEG